MSTTKQRVSGAVKGVGLAGLIGVLTPVHVAHRAASLARTSRRTGATCELERVRLDQRPLREIMAAGRPVIVTDLVERIDFHHRPDADGLRSLAATCEVTFPVRFHADHSPYFLYVGDYGAEQTGSTRMTLGEFVDLMFGGGLDPGTSVYKLFSIKELDGAIASMIDDIADALEPMTDRTPDRHASGVWVGSAGVVTPLHHDAWTGLLLQTEGSKQVSVFSPADRANLSFVSPFRPTERWSTLPPRSREADAVDFPRLDRVTRWQSRLDAGEALFIPPYWGHEVEALEANVSIPFRFATRPVDFVNPGFLRPAVEIFHGKYLAAR